MKLLLRPATVFASLLIFGLSAQAAQTPAAPNLPPAPANAAVPSPAPKVVSARIPLSREELAKYQQKDSKDLTTKAAGSDDSESWWIVGGAVAVVAIVIIVAGGGHGGSGGGGY
jgi:hypothetical protein